MASGDTLLIFIPQCSEPPASNFATLDLRNLHPVLDFDDATNESIIFRGIMPMHYAGGGITVRIHYAMTSAVELTIDWDASFERIGYKSQDIDADGFAGVKSINDITVPSTCGHVDIANILFADGAEIDSIIAGDSFRLKITRDAVSDDAVGDAELLLVELRET